MKQKLNSWEIKLNIDTSGCDASKEDSYYYAYEPTPYSVLERLIESHYISEKNKVIDYGCGKGRVACLLNHQLHCNVLGIDFNEQIYETAQKNLISYMKGKENCKVRFICEAAEKYEVKDEDAFYFFNPFSVEILRSVIGKIVKSYYCNPRKMYLFFYFPSDEYVSYLMTVPELCFWDEIDCTDLFLSYNEREKILIFEID